MKYAAPIVTKPRMSAMVALAGLGFVLLGGVVWAKTIPGAAGNDTLRGTPAADALYGKGGHDKLYGFAGNDRLVGGPGNDVLVGGPGADTLTCGGGRDTANADMRDKVANDCESVKGIAKPPIAAWRICTNCIENGGDLSRYRYIGTNAWYYQRIPGWKAANPAMKALVYKDMSSTRSHATPPLTAGGITYQYANARHPDWFTLDAAGTRIEWTGFAGAWQMDVGNQAYQDQWAANVIAELEANGWDGVVVDNANVDQSDYLGGKTMAEYPTRESYQAATRSFLARVGPQVIAAGFLFLPNIQASPTLATPSLWADWLQFTSGGTREYWCKWGHDIDGQYGDARWDALQQVFATVQNAGKIFLPVMYAPKTDSRSIRWARANFLMFWNGGPSAFIFAPTPENQDAWSLEWTSNIGTPTGAAVQVGTGYKRTFTRATVYLNRSPSANVTIDGHTLAPLTGLVM